MAAEPHYDAQGDKAAAAAVLACWRHFGMPIQMHSIPNEHSTCVFEVNVPPTQSMNMSAEAVTAQLSMARFQAMFQPWAPHLFLRSIGTTTDARTGGLVITVDVQLSADSARVMSKAIRANLRRKKAANGT